MVLRPLLFRLLSFAAVGGSLLASGGVSPPPGLAGDLSGRPNILWITAEDIAPNLGCYGDSNAVTPNLDRFAARSLRFTNVFSVHPCCSPSRSALVTGVYPTRLGTFQHRGQVVVSEKLVQCFPSLLRAAGYHTFNGMKGGSAKLDYNFAPQDQPWAKVGSQEIEWRHRAASQPFFGQVNLFCTHQSQYGTDQNWRTTPAWARVHDSAKITVPAYHPDVPAVREIWRQYHDRMTQMDGEFAQLIGQLAADGLADDTIVFWFSDNGHGIPGGKIWLWDQGVHVPLLVHVPAKWSHLVPGERVGVSERMISFVDFAPTVLALAGVRAPDYLDGQAFLGLRPGPARDRVFGARDFHNEADFDTSRMVREGRWHYIRNFLPHLGWDPILYSWQQAPAMLDAWRQAAAAGKLQAATRQSAFFRQRKPPEELYDSLVDPNQLNNLAGDPAHRGRLESLRAAIEAWMNASHDAGLLSQYEFYMRSATDSPYAMAADPQRNPVARLLAAANLANRCDPRHLPQLRELLRADEATERRWGALGLCALGVAAAPARGELVSALRDPSPDVRLIAAESLVAIAGFDAAMPTLVDLLAHPSQIIRNETLIALCRLGLAANPILPQLSVAAGPVSLHQAIRAVPLELPRACLDPAGDAVLRRTRSRYLP